MAEAKVKMTAEEKKAAKEAEKARKAKAKAKKAEENKNKTGFFRSVKAEMKKITWYPKKATLINSVWVAVALVIIAAVTGLVDAGLSKGLEILRSFVA